MDDQESVTSDISKEERPRNPSGVPKDDSGNSAHSTKISPSNKVPRLAVNREMTCPMLIRMFCREGGFHSSEIFSQKYTLPVDDELTIYSWKDATLKELTTLIKEVYPEARALDLKFLFRFYHTNEHIGKEFRYTDFGIVVNNGRKNYTKFSTVSKDLEQVCDEERNLSDAHFIQGDYIDVAMVHVREQIPFNLPLQSSTHTGSSYYRTSYGESGRNHSERRGSQSTNSYHPVYETRISDRSGKSIETSKSNSRSSQRNFQVRDENDPPHGNNRREISIDVRRPRNS